MNRAMMPLAVMVAMLLGILPLMAVTTDRQFLAWGALVIVAMQLISAIGGRTGWARSGVHLAQIAVLGLIVVASGWGLLSATPDWTANIAELLEGAIDHIRNQSAPMEPHPGVMTLMVLLIGLVTYVADVLAVTLLSPVWTIAPLLTLYAIPALALRTDVSWWAFVATSVGYLVVLVADHLSSASLWTRNLVGDSAGRRLKVAGGAGSMAALVAVPTLIVGLLAGSVLPAMATWSPGQALGRTDGPIQLADPSVDLQKNLNQPDDQTVITYQTDDPDGLYLRMTTLPQLSDKGFELTKVQLENGDLPPVPGVGNAPANVTAQVQIQNLDSEYLPVPYAPRSFDAPGEWRFDPVSLSIIAIGEDREQATRGISYQVTATTQGPDPDVLANSPAGNPPEGSMVTDLPANVPDQIVQLSHEWTKDASTPALKAAAIQAHLRDPNEFSYDTSAPPGMGLDVLTNFLFNTKAGYCVHFASAMALMARIEGIPSRIAVGFLPGEKNGDSWEVGIHAYHAWPELYFRDTGWVRFEPTIAMTPPSWSLVNPTPESSASPSPSTSATPSSSTTPTPSESPSFDVSQQPETAVDATDQGPQISWGAALGWTLGALVVAAILAGPAVARGVFRRRRLDPDQDPPTRVQGAWQEVRAMALDWGYSWPPGAPRTIATRLAVGLDPDAAAHLRSLALLEERRIFAREGGSVDSIADDVDAVRSGLMAQVTGRRRLVAKVFPRSLFMR